jgi:hypothetical protein
VLFGRFSLSLTLFMTKLRVLVLSFPDFADTSTMHIKYWIQKVRIICFKILCV